jgi:hypothetical protein
MRKLLTAILLFTTIHGYSQNKVIWYDPITVADKTFGNRHPRVTLDALQNPIVLWGDDDGRAYMARWEVKGFKEPFQVNTPGAHVFAETWAGPEMAGHGDTVYVVYKNMPEETGHVFLKHSYDGGRHFSIETEVDDTDGYISRFPTVAMDPYGNPMVAYMKMNEGYTSARYVVAKSKDLGETFKGETTISDYSGGHVSDCCPATVVESGNATVILYRDNLRSVRDIWAGISRNAAVSFDKGLQVDKTGWYSPSCPANPPHGVIVGDTLYSVFTSGSEDSALAYMSKVSLSGLSYDELKLSGRFPGLISQNFPRIANSGNATAIAWEQSLGETTQECMYFTNDITTGLPASYDTVGKGMCGNVDVAVGGGHIYVVWQDDSSGNIMCRVGHYEETETNRLLSENTTVSLQRSANGKYFTVNLPHLAYCMMVDLSGKEYEMDMKCKHNTCKIYTEDLDPGMYVVRLHCDDEKVYTYKYEVKETKEKEEKEK